MSEDSPAKANFTILTRFYKQNSTIGTLHEQNSTSLTILKLISKS